MSRDIEKRCTAHYKSSTDPTTRQSHHHCMSHKTMHPTIALQADEPTGNTDSDCTARALAHLRSYIVAHQLQEAEDRKLPYKDGRVVRARLLSSFETLGSPVLAIPVECPPGSTFRITHNQAVGRTIQGVAVKASEVVHAEAVGRTSHVWDDATLAGCRISQIQARETRVRRMRPQSAY